MRTLIHPWWECNWYNHIGKLLEVATEDKHEFTHCYNLQEYHCINFLFFTFKNFFCFF